MLCSLGKCIVAANTKPNSPSQARAWLKFEFPFEAKPEPSPNSMPKAEPSRSPTQIFLLETSQAFKAKYKKNQG